MDKAKLFESRISKVKKSLIVKARRRGIYENFGQTEIQKLTDELLSEVTSYSSEYPRLIKEVYALENWCQTYNG